MCGCRTVEDIVQVEDRKRDNHLPGTLHCGLLKGSVGTLAIHLKRDGKMEKRLKQVKREIKK